MNEFHNEKGGGQGPTLAFQRVSGGGRTNTPSESDKPVGLGIAPSGEVSEFVRCALTHAHGLEPVFIPRADCTPQGIAQIDAALATMPAELRISLQDAAGLTEDRDRTALVCFRLSVPKWRTPPSVATGEYLLAIHKLFRAADAAAIFVEARAELERRRAEVARQVEAEHERKLDEEARREAAEVAARSCRGAEWLELPENVRVALKAAYSLPVGSAGRGALMALADAFEKGAAAPPADWMPGGSRK